MDAFRVSDRTLGLIVGVGALAYLVAAWRIPPFSLGTVPVQSRAFPLGLGAMMLVLAAVLVLRSVTPPRAGDDQPTMPPDRSLGESGPAADATATASDGTPDVDGEVVVARLRDPRHEVLALLGGVAAYVAVLEPVGFVVATVVYLQAMAAWFRLGRPVVAVVVSVGVALGAQQGLAMLGVPLPPGLLAPLGW